MHLCCEGHKELEEDQPHAVDVHLVAVGLTLPLLGGHVGKSAHLVSVLAMMVPSTRVTLGPELVICH